MQSFDGVVKNAGIAVNLYQRAGGDWINAARLLEDKGFRPSLRIAQNASAQAEKFYSKIIEYTGFELSMKLGMLLNILQVLKDILAEIRKLDRRAVNRIIVNRTINNAFNTLNSYISNAFSYFYTYNTDYKEIISTYEFYNSEIYNNTSTFYMLTINSGNSEANGKSNEGFLSKLWGTLGDIFLKALGTFADTAFNLFAKFVDIGSDIVFSAIGKVVDKAVVIVLNVIEKIVYAVTDMVLRSIDKLVDKVVDILLDWLDKLADILFEQYIGGKFNGFGSSEFGLKGSTLLEKGIGGAFNLSGGNNLSGFIHESWDKIKNNFFKATNPLKAETTNEARNNLEHYKKSILGYDIDTAENQNNFWLGGKAFNFNDKLLENLTAATNKSLDPQRNTFNISISGINKTTDQIMSELVGKIREAANTMGEAVVA